MSEQLSGPVFYDVIASVANSEMKSLVFAQMRDGATYTALPLHDKVMAMQGEEPAWAISSQAAFSYCETFATIGEIVDRTTNPAAYTINDRGRSPVISLVGHCLDVSLNEGVSLSAFHGPTQSSERGIRPCQRRIEIMSLVRRLDGRSTPLIEVATELGMDANVVGPKTEDLARYGIINHGSSDRSQPTAVFAPRCDLWSVSLRADSSQLFSDVLEVLRQHFAISEEPISNRHIASELVEIYGYEDSLAQLTARVANKTHQLVNGRKVLTAYRGREGDQVRGSISAGPQQLEAIDSLLRAVEGVRRPSTSYLLDGSDKLEGILSNTQTVQHLVSKAYRDSSGLKRKPAGQLATDSAIDEALAGKIQAQTVRNIHNTLLNGEVNLDRATVRQHLKKRAMLGQVALETTSEGFRFSLVPTG